MAPITKECPGFMKNLDTVIIDKAKSKLSLNWSLVVVFLATFLLCIWLLIKNAVSIYNVYTEWKTNVLVSKKDRSRSFIRDIMDPSFDDEIYEDTSDVFTKSDFHDNAYIRKRIRDVKKAYSGYNKALQKAGNGKEEDVVDERILSGEHDHYKSTNEPVDLDISKKSQNIVSK